MGEATDVGAFAARDLEVQFREAVEVDLEVVDMDVAGFQFHLFVGPGIVEGAFAFDLDGGIFRRFVYLLKPYLSLFHHNFHINH